MTRAFNLLLCFCLLCTLFWVWAEITGPTTMDHRTIEQKFQDDCKARGGHYWYDHIAYKHQCTK